LLNRHQRKGKKEGKKDIRRRRPEKRASRCLREILAYGGKGTARGEGEKGRNKRRRPFGRDRRQKGTFSRSLVYWRGEGKFWGLKDRQPVTVFAMRKRKKRKEKRNGKSQLRPCRDKRDATPWTTGKNRRTSCEEKKKRGREQGELIHLTFLIVIAPKSHQS